MKLTLFAMILISAMTQHVVADDRCPHGSSKPIAIDSWQVTKIDDAHDTLDLQVESRLPKPFHLIQAGGGFDDAIGQYLGGYSFPPDTKLAPGVPMDVRIDLLSQFFPRILVMAKDDVRPFFCTDAVVYDDWSQEAFSPTP